MSKHPMQPIEKDENGVVRFKHNNIITYLFESGKLSLNDIACMNFSNEDHMQIAQLLGYSVSGFGDLSYADDGVVNEADNLAEDLINDNNLTTHDQPVVRVGTAAIVQRGSQILMGKRKGSHSPGTWSLPGGHVDFGEEPEYSIRREIMEETGLLVGTISPLESLPYVNTHFREEGKQYITLYYVAEYIGGAPKVMEPDKCETWDWFSTGSLPSPLFEPLGYEPLMKALASTKQE